MWPIPACMGFVGSKRNATFAGSTCQYLMTVGIFLLATCVDAALRGYLLSADSSATTSSADVDDIVGQ